LERATRRAHRWSAQYGQYSAPTYDTTPLVVTVESDGETRSGMATVDGSPTDSRVAFDTFTAASKYEVNSVAGAVGEEGERVRATTPNAATTKMTTALPVRTRCRHCRR
jgi:hypothetical protein